MKSRGTYLVSNAISGEAFIRWNSIAPSGNPILAERRHIMRPPAKEVTRRGYKLGVAIVGASDFAYSSAAGWPTITDNAAGLAEIGLPMMEAIKAITSRAAKCLGIDNRTGAIRTGLEADIVVLNEDPLSSVEALKDILMIVNDGKVVFRKTF
jgi:imidazolonepropionase-like amidohydrolase